jgi:hypothetical protein
MEEEGAGVKPFFIYRKTAFEIWTGDVVVIF